MKVGLFGGSFNPFHNGHLYIAKKLVEKIVDETWIIPCRSHAFEKELTDIEKRINMIDLGIKNQKNIRLMDVEPNNKKSYSAETIRYLNKNFSHDFYFIIGSDNLKDLDKWHDFNFLKNNVGFILVQRKGYELDSRDDINIRHTLDVKKDISSTDIRDKLRKNIFVGDLITRNVEKYIRKENLYSNPPNPSSTVDLIVQKNNEILLIKRKYDPFKEMWALPGGFIDYGKETLEEAAIRELKEETGLLVKTNDLKLSGVYSSPNRDPRRHIISHAFAVEYFNGKIKADDDAKEARFFSLDNLPELAFDHDRIIGDYKDKKLKGGNR
jgi:8-oxo-dGTP diphosphatase